MTVHRVWAFGREKDLDTSLHALAEAKRGETFEKYQIVLHFTATPFSRVETTTGEFVIDGMNNGDRNVGIHFVVGRTGVRSGSGAGAPRVVQAIEDANLDRAPIHCAIFRNAIGIEIINIGKFIDGRRTLPFDELPSTIRADSHSYYHMQRRIDNCTAGYYQAFLHEQYVAMILLLRRLCVLKRIPRVFLGNDAQTNLAEHWDGSAHPGWRQFDRRRVPLAVRNEFRGILSHCNVHPNKSCGGPALHRNRLYRGIIDECWPPVDLEEGGRRYYTGPFADDRNLSQVDGSGDPTPFWTSDLNLLQDTRSYFNLGNADTYFQHVEGGVPGTFPIGSNACWHGGVHFLRDADSARVFAAASGTIVAARMGTIPAIEQVHGSPRFVLIKHTMYTQTQDVDGTARINYSVDPTPVFSLYMHLAPLPTDGDNPIEPGHEDFDGHADIPEWYKQGRSRNGGVDITQVFDPNVQIMVGDYLGNCEQWYRHEHCLHFEIVSNQWTDTAPWNADASNHVEESHYKPPFTFAGQLAARGIPALRDCAYRHISEWAIRWQEFSQASRSRETYDQIQQILWYHETRRVWQREGNRDLLSQLPDNGVLVHYHPVTFMRVINELLNQQGDYAGHAPSIRSASAGGSSTGPAHGVIRRQQDIEGENVLTRRFRFSI
jgi:hypothetical protein